MIIRKMCEIRNFVSLGCGGHGCWWRGLCLRPIGDVLRSTLCLARVICHTPFAVQGVVMPYLPLQLPCAPSLHRLLYLSSTVLSRMSPSFQHFSCRYEETIYNIQKYKVIYYNCFCRVHS